MSATAEKIEQMILNDEQRQEAIELLSNGEGNIPEDERQQVIESLSDAPTLTDEKRQEVINTLSHGTSPALTPPRAEALIRSEIEEQGRKKIADEMGILKNTVDNTIREAKRDVNQVVGALKVLDDLAKITGKEVEYPYTLSGDLSKDNYARAGIDLRDWRLDGSVEPVITDTDTESGNDS